MDTPVSSTGQAMGLLLAVVVHAANIQDRDGAKLVLAKLLGRFLACGSSGLMPVMRVGWWPGPRAVGC